MRFIVPLVVGLVGVAILASLGTWQLRRLAWKDAILADIETRIAADPVSIPDVPDPERDRFLSVATRGEITDQEVHVLVSTKDVGAAFRIIALFQTEDGRRLLLDRGIVPDEAKDAPRPPVTATIRGNLHWPDETDAFTPDADRDSNLWYARDVDALSAELAAEPFLVVMRSTSEAAPPVTPLPVSTSGIPNDHLQYAITWFGLALVWTAMTLYWIARRARGED